MANHGPSYGLSRDIEKKNQARFILEEAQEIISWVQQTTEIPFPIDPMEINDSNEFCNLLKDGVQLCYLINRLLKLDKQSLIKFKESPVMPFHKMENISTFLEAIKRYGVLEFSCFQTVDLYENKHPYKVVECLRSLAGVAQFKNAKISFPPWVVKMAQSNKRHFSKDIIKQGEVIIPLQYGTNKCASQKGMTPYGLGRQITLDNTLSKKTC
ncbi:Calponin repeat and Calponin homology domain and Smooth muscle protein/calponin family-containing protein [Strongyloides ratti]|uniref:Transgelin n=1 Tax=Strongyloides ratti TaxID=34506 RepID=A0A090KYN2_STRRB|nr:Calponin repeat and Calponin homology domain and Smooth muscle protein/calponin family-containing protein [Strongyloides ratti]CEF60319.1 Calponin repeat and Calponin homology domain and Smooth muscle protein/calponin family-containing protein [Strongyloides ratti]